MAQPASQPAATASFETTKRDTRRGQEPRPFVAWLWSMVGQLTRDLFNQPGAGMLLAVGAWEGSVGNGCPKVT